MSCDTNMSKLLVRWASDTYIRCLLPQLLWCMPLHVMFPLPTTSLHRVCSALCCMYSVLYDLLQTAWFARGHAKQTPGDHPGYCRVCPCADNPHERAPPRLCTPLLLAHTCNNTTHLARVNASPIDKHTTGSVHACLSGVHARWNMRWSMHASIACMLALYKMHNNLG